MHYTVQEYENLARLVHAKALPATLETDLRNSTGPDLAGGAVLVWDTHLVRIHIVAALDEGTETVRVAPWRPLIATHSLSEL